MMKFFKKNFISIYILRKMATKRKTVRRKALVKPRYELVDRKTGKTKKRYKSIKSLMK